MRRRASKDRVGSRSLSFSDKGIEAGGEKAPVRKESTTPPRNTNSSMGGKTASSNQKGEVTQNKGEDSRKWNARKPTTLERGWFWCPARTTTSSRFEGTEPSNSPNHELFELKDPSPHQGHKKGGKKTDKWSGFQRLVNMWGPGGRGRLRKENSLTVPASKKSWGKRGKKKGKPQKRVVREKPGDHPSVPS